MSKPILGYWNLRGLTQPIRLIAAYVGLDVEEKRYGLELSGFEEWTKDKFNLGLEFPNLPYWKEGEVVLTESRAILRYLAREKSTDLMPTKPELLRQADMLENMLFDVWMNVIRTCLTYTDEAIANLSNTMPKKFQELNAFLGTKKFLLGDQLSYVDFIFYEVIFFYQKYDPDFLKASPAVENFRKTFEAIPAIAKYIGSSDYVASPCLHPLKAKKLID